MTVLIIEDEIYNYKLLRHMLEELVPDCITMGPAYSILQARQYLEGSSDIDLIIADIQLSDGLSFDALKYAPDDIPIIFTTAYDEHALKAFEFNSLSYLLKPIDEEELRVALRKAKRLGTHESHGYSELFHRLNTSAKPYRERFVVKTSRGEKIIPLFNIRYIVSEQKLTYIKLVDGDSYHVSMSLDILSQQLDPSRFVRANRKYIVPIDQIEELSAIENGKEQLILKGDNAPEIIVSRKRKIDIKKQLQ